MKECSTLGRMKIVEIAVKELGSLSELQQGLVRLGISVSHSALSQAQSKSKESLRLDIVAGIVELAFDGDWAKAGKVIKDEFLPKELTGKRAKKLD